MSMISYTIIGQQHYSRLIQQNEQWLIDKAILQKNNFDMKQQVKMLKNWLKMLRDQSKLEKSQNLLLLAHLRLQATKLNQINNKFHDSTQTVSALKSQQNETTHLISVLQQKNKKMEEQNKALEQKAKSLNNEIISIKQENQKLIKNEKSLQYKITQMSNRIIELELQNQKIGQQLKENEEKLNFANSQLKNKSQLLQNVISQYEQCKNQKSKCEEQIQKFKQSPIPKLEEMLKAKQTWITELSKTISQLRQKCIQLQMMHKPQKFQSKGLLINGVNAGNNKKSSQNFIAPYQKNENTQIIQPAPFIAPSLPTQLKFIQKQRQKQQELQRIKYLTICRQLARQFTSKLGKIQQQKKSLEQKYQSIRLKLNEYQYNQFRYKDKINLYVQKIQRFEKFTKRQQQEMQRLIEQFDEELNNMLKKKQNQVKLKFQEEIEKYQTQLQKRVKQDEQLIFKKSQSSSSQSSNNSVDLKDKYLFSDDPFQLQMLKIQLQQLKFELNQKYQENQLLIKENRKLKNQLEKTKKSKQSYKQKFLQIQEQCYEKSTQLRRCKTIVQQLCHELQIKANELQIVKRQWLKNTASNGTSSSNSQKNNNEDAFESLSAKLSSENNRRSLKRENSEYWEYQVSEIDTEGQRKNQSVLNNLIVGKLGCYNNIFRNQDNENMKNNAPGMPTKMSQITDPQNNYKTYKNQLNPAVNELIDSIHNSRISSLSSSESMSQNTSSTPNNSVSSKNSYQSYGIKYLYKEKLSENGRKFIMHKNSLQ